MIRRAWFVLLVFLQLVVVAGAQPSRVIEAAAPSYPRLPSGGRESGDVAVEIMITPSGEVASAKAASGPTRLRAVAESAARRWRFESHSGPSEKWVITFGFNLKPGLGDPPPVFAIFKGPDRIDVFAEERKIVTIADPPVEDVDKTQK